ncbi:Phosphatase YbjI [Dermatophilus congolensis]|uniref:Phosphatase YbjI n=1 Tax=Dermatophilus congolensis TaxID=1863 RepID=A0AA46BQU0_9MICO|nr:HAD family hydrolase [Dermatophilus congolensis]STD15608.1 Phosphatase YbjI [Dermatophilus congolensis]
MNNQSEQAQTTSANTQPWAQGRRTVHDVPAHLVPALVVADMDGSLLDSNGNIPDTFWDVLTRMRERGIAFAPASGRQLATLRELFAPAGDNLYTIAENGAYVVHGDEEISSVTLDHNTVTTAINIVRNTHEKGHRLGAVVCGKRSAYVEWNHQPFLDQCRVYYAALELVEDLHTIDDDILKVAIFDFGPAEEIAHHFNPLRHTHQVVISGPNWIDVMSHGVHKGLAVQELQKTLGIDRKHTLVFGDYFNDAHMLDTAELSFAMANGHPEIIQRANYIAPPNTEHGTITVLETLLNR